MRALIHSPQITPSRRAPRSLTISGHAGTRRTKGMDSPDAMSLFPPLGPPLPQFTSLLIQGRYHATAPIHLCLSHVRQPDATRAILVVPSRAALTDALRQLKDAWISVHGGEGSTVVDALKVDVLSVLPVAVTRRTWEAHFALQVSSNTGTPHLPLDHVPRGVER